MNADESAADRHLRLSAVPHMQIPENIWPGTYLDGEINLGKAAELLSLHRLELQNRFLMQGIPLRLGSETLEEAKAETDAIMNWNSSD